MDTVAAEGLAVVEVPTIGVNNWLPANTSMFAIRVFLCVGGTTSDLLSSLISIDGVVFGYECIC